MYHFHGFKTTDRQSRKIFWILFLYNSLFYVPGATYGAYIGVYYKMQGMSVSQIGILSAIGPLLALVMQPAWGILSDKKGHIKILRVVLLGAMAGVQLYYMANTFWLFVLCVLIYTFFNCAIAPISDAVIVNMASENNLEFSSIRMGGTIAYAVVVVLAGMFLDERPTASFGITAAVWGGLFLVTFFMTGKVKSREPKKKVNPMDVFKDKKILFILFYACVYQIVQGCYGAFLGVMVTDMGYSNVTIGRLMCVSALSELPILLTINYLMRKIRVEYLLLMAGVLMTVRIWLPLTGMIGFIFLGQSLQGATYMVMYYSCVMYMNKNLPKELHGTGQSMFYMVQTGIACTFSNLVGGWLGDHFGLNVIYFSYGMILLVITLICGVVLYRKFDAAEGKIFLKNNKY